MNTTNADFLVYSEVVPVLINLKMSGAGFKRMLLNYGILAWRVPEGEDSPVLMLNPGLEGFALGEVLPSEMYSPSLARLREFLWNREGVEVLSEFTRRILALDKAYIGVPIVKEICEGVRPHGKFTPAQCQNLTGGNLTRKPGEMIDRGVLLPDTVSLLRDEQERQMPLFNHEKFLADVKRGSRSPMKK